MQPDHVATIARRLNVPEREVIEMNRRFLETCRSMRLHEWTKKKALSGRSALADPTSNFEDDVAERSELNWRRQILGQALAHLKPREQRIIEARWLSDTPLTLDDLAAELGVSRERVRQVEVRALEKARAYAALLAGDMGAK